MIKILFNLNSTNNFHQISFLFAASNIYFIQSQRKKPLLIVNDYLYRRNRDSYWRCIRCTSQKCRASLILSDSEFVTLCITDHTHPPETDKIRNKEKYAFDSSILESIKADKESIRSEMKSEFKIVS